MPMFVRRPIRRRPPNKTKRSLSPVDGGQRSISPTPGQQRRLSTPTLVLPTQSLTPQPNRRATLPFLPLSPQPPRRRRGDDSVSSGSADDSSPGCTPTTEELQHSMLALIASPRAKRAQSSSRLERRRDRSSVSPASSDEDLTFDRLRSLRSSEELAAAYRRHSPRGSPRVSPRASPRASPRVSPRSTPRATTPTRDAHVTQDSGRRSSGDSLDRARRSSDSTERGRRSSDSTDVGRHSSDSSERGATFADYERGRHPPEVTEYGRRSSDSSDKSSGRGSESRDTSRRARHSEKGRRSSESITERSRHAPELDSWRQNSSERGRRSSDSDRDSRSLAEVNAEKSKERLGRRRSGPPDIRHHRRQERHVAEFKNAHAPDNGNCPPSPSRAVAGGRMQTRSSRPSLTQIDERHGGDGVFRGEREERGSPRRLNHQISIEETDEHGECFRVETIEMERAQALQRHRTPRRSLPTPPTTKTLERVKLQYSNSLKLGHGHDSRHLGHGRRPKSPCRPKPDVSMAHSNYR